jgi:hypothetical protein
VLHDEEGRPLPLPGVVDPHDVRVHQPGGGERLETEPFAEEVVCGEVGMQDLDRDGAIENLVACVPNRADRPIRNFRFEAVAARELDLDHVRNP